MISLIYTGEHYTYNDYDLMTGDIYEFEVYKSYLYNVTQVRNGEKKKNIGNFKLPEIGKEFITLAEWRNQQIDSILDE
jgi:hypothetical protein